ncbi:hypothetical protein ACMX2M_07475 [Paenibacillus polymyxa]
MQLKRLLSSGRVLFWTLTFISFLSIFLVKFAWVNTPPPEWFPWGHEFGELVNDLCIGYLVSVIFYYIVVYIPEKRNKSAANSGIITIHIPQFLSHTKKILGLLYFKMETDKELTMLTKDDFIKIERIAPSESVEFCIKNIGSVVALVVKGNNQGNFLRSHRDALKQSINDMFSSPLSKYLDSDFVRIIGKIKHCRFLDNISNIAEGNDYMDHREAMYDFYELYMELSKLLTQECLFDVEPNYHTYYKPISPGF